MKNIIILSTLSTSILLTICAMADKSATSKDPESLKRLRNSWHQAKERALKPINTKYLRELKKLKIKYTKLGKLEEALAVQKEIGLLEDKAKIGLSKKEQTMNLLTSSSCTWGDGSALIFKPDGNTISKHSFIGSFSVREDGMFIIKKSTNNSIFWVFKLDKNNKTAKPILSEGSFDDTKRVHLVKANKPLRPSGK